MGLFGCCKKPEGAKKPKSLKKRTCTDIICLILFILFTALMIGIFVFGALTGDWHSLVYDADYMGNRCGVGQFKDKPKAFYPRIPLDMLSQPEVVKSGNFWKLELYALCVDKCPGKFDIDNPDLIQDYGYDPSSATTQALGAGTRPQWISATPTVSIVNRCIPREQSSTAVTTLCALPKCDHGDVLAVGGVCETSGAYNGTGAWYVCPTAAESASGVAVTGAACTAQQSVCEVNMKDSTKRSFEISTGDAESSALLATVAEAVGGVFEISSAIYDAWVMILVGGILLPVVLAFCYMLLLYMFAKTIIWGLLIVLILCQLVATFICFSKSGITINGTSGADLISKAANLAGNVTVPSVAEAALAEAEESDQWLYSTLFVVMCVVTIITMIMVAMSRKKIARAAAIVKEATTVFRSMPLMMFFPSFSTMIQILVCFWFIAMLLLVQTTKAESIDLALDLAANISSPAYINLPGNVQLAVPNIDPIAGLRDLSESENFGTALTVLVIYGFFVIIQWVAGIAWCAMSGATYYWYFFGRHPEREESQAEKTTIPITRALTRTLFYHTGSVAFAAFIIAICDLLRVICAYVERQMKPLKDKQFLLKLLFLAINCCLWCLKKSVKFISYYGLVFVACQGTSFCSGCYKTFFFFLTNPGQVAINATVTWLLRTCALFSMPLACGVVFYYIIAASSSHAIYPALIITVLAALMTVSCMTVFECCITTIFVCCFQDKAEFEGVYMSDQLAKAFGIQRKGQAGGNYNSPEQVSSKGGGGSSYGEEPTQKL